MTDTPIVAWANPKPDEEWRCYLDGVIKVRRLNSGIVQIAVEGEGWRDA